VWGKLSTQKMDFLKGGSYDNATRVLKNWRKKEKKVPALREEKY